MTCVEAKFGLIIRDSEPSDTGLREHSDVGAVDSLSSVEKKSSVPRVGCSKCDGAHFQRDCKQERWQGIVRPRQSKQVMVQE